MRREKCGGCGSPDLCQFLDLGETPVADRFPAKPEPDTQRWPLGLTYCEACRLVQLTEIVPDDVVWEGYGFHTGGSPSAAAYFEAYADELVHLLKPTQVRAPFVVEVACNDGTLLAHLDAPCRALGVEPARAQAAAARARGLDVITAPFGHELAQAIVADHGQADLVVANNVLAHVADLDDFVAGLALLLAPGGRLVVEVQYLGDLLLGNGFDLVYHQHRSFFSVRSLAAVLGRRDLIIVDVARTPAQGGSLRVAAARDAQPTADVVDLIDAERRFNLAGQLPTLQGRADAVRDRMCELVASERAAGRAVVAYGAPAKATTLLHWCGLTSSADIEVVYDATPSKDGRFMPGTDIPIVHKPTLSYLSANHTAAILLSHNYLPGVVRREREFLDAGGRFIVPLPVPAVI